MSKLGLNAKYPVLDNIDANRKLFVKESHWIVGGDGWAYDIGLDHIFSKNQNINILVFDTEMYVLQYRWVDIQGHSSFDEY